jgi:hypothetical protein
VGIAVPGQRNTLRILNLGLKVDTTDSRINLTWRRMAQYMKSVMMAYMQVAMAVTLSAVIQHQIN